MAVKNDANTNALNTLPGILERGNELLISMLANVSAATEGGRKIDDHQIATRKIARHATRMRAAHALLTYANTVENPDDSLHRIAELFICETVDDLFNEAARAPGDFGLEAVPKEEARKQIGGVLTESNYRALGRAILQGDPQYTRWILSETGDGSDENDLRSSTRRFADSVIAPVAEKIHRETLLIPEDIITQVGELGYFGMSVPEVYGGVGMSSLMMVVATEELSRASLSAAGSLITRPEILEKALLKGGTDAQKEKWLPPISAGNLMVAISVTEPNIGSDVANIACRATPTTVMGEEGYVLNGAKAWCTFAGRADIIALLARTEPDPDLGHKGLSLFIVEKDRFSGKDFEMTQRSGGKLAGKADAPPGYRGMHSFSLQFTDYFVPAENLVGEDAGRGRGFYLQMEGFAAGRLQTGGRALGVAQAGLEAAVNYTRERPQFGRPVSEYQNTEYEIGAIAVQLEAGRQLTYAAARAMDRDDADAALMASMAKLFASRMAVEVTQRAQILHGGWGYGEEYPISRYVIDALVLPIFEGVEPILELKVVGRALLNK